MNSPSRWQRVNSSAGSERPVRYGVGFSIACLALYILVMAGVRFYAHSIGVVGGFSRIMFEPKLGKSLGVGGSSCPEGLTLSAV